MQTLLICAHLVDQEVVSKLAELDMMVDDLERANSRVVTVERRNVIITVIEEVQEANICLGTSPRGNRGYQEWQ